MSYYPYSYAANRSGCRPPPRVTPNPGKSWQDKIINPLICITVAISLSLLINHLSNKYSASSSPEDPNVDISLLRNSLNKLMTEVRAIRESKDEIKESLKDVSSVVPQLSEAIKHLRTELFDRMQESIQKVVKYQLQIYDADKTGQADFALQSSGGSILCTKDAKPIEGDDSLRLLGVPICTQHNKPESIIQPSVLPGECWAFKGHTASVFIKLLREVFVTGFSLEHIPASISPTLDNSAAPKEFGIWAVEDPNDRFQGRLLGKYVYDNRGDPVQYFPIQEKTMGPSKIIELRVFSNNGHPNYTCIYRLRVHGTFTTCPRSQGT